MKQNKKNTKGAKNLATVKKQKSTEVTEVDIRKATPLTADELHRIEAKKKNSHCPHRVKRIWDAEKGKYVKVKIYKKRIKMNRKELETFFGHKFIATKPAPKQKFESRGKEVPQPKPKVMPARKEDCFTIIHGMKLKWNPKTLYYDLAA